MADTDGNEGISKKTLQEEIAALQAYREALEQEFDIQNNPDLADQAVVIEKTKAQMIKGLAEATTGMIELAKTAESESVKFNAQKYIIEFTCGKPNSGDGDNSGLESLLRELSKNDS